LKLTIGGGEGGKEVKMGKGKGVQAEFWRCDTCGWIIFV
jgi:hypothetical protein